MLIRRALESRMPTTAGPVDISQANGVLTLGFGGGPTAAGVSISESTAESLTTVYACVGLLAETIAQVPLKVFRNLEPRGREPAPEHPLYSVLHDLPNAEMTAFDLRQTMARWLFLWGNAYAEIVRDSQGRVMSLWPLRADAMQVERDPSSLRLRYRYTRNDGTTQTWFYNGDRPPIHHWRINSLDGITGRSPIRVLRESLGLTKAAEEFGSRYFGNGAQPGGLLTTDGKLDKERALRMREDWERLHMGVDRSHRIAVFEQGLKFQPMTVPPDDAQFLETRKFQVEEVARIYRVPPYAIGHTAPSTSWGTGIESQKNGMVTFTMMPHFVAIQQASKRDLLGRKDFERYEVLFVPNALLRGDLPTRMTAYAAGLNWHIYTVNDVRDFEDLNPREGGDNPMPPLSTSSDGSLKQSTPDAGAAGAGAEPGGGNA